MKNLIFSLLTVFGLIMFNATLNWKWLLLSGIALVVCWVVDECHFWQPFNHLKNKVKKAIKVNNH